MIWAISNQERIRAEPNKTAFCPICSEQVIPKCGEIKIWHWAHKVDRDCDSWAEPDSEWHIKWQNEFPKEEQEVVMKKDGMIHRADIKTKTGKIIEFQSCSISAEDVRIREAFYGENMVWLLNGDTIAKNFCYNPIHKTWYWLWKPSIYKYSKRTIFIEKPCGIVRLSEKRFGCYLLDKDNFLKIYGDVYGRNKN
jgi:competence CoiA-like predicted nuclease